MSFNSVLMLFQLQFSIDVNTWLSDEQADSNLETLCSPFSPTKNQYNIPLKYTFTCDGIEMFGRLAVRVFCRFVAKREMRIFQIFCNCFKIVSFANRE